VENTHGFIHSFDVVSMWHVLEHVPDLDLQIKEKRILKPSGTLIVAVPNFKSMMQNTMAPLGSL
jgi:2-polyprenyl-3-methyl-5-hydroxy-6-metoxy-1,4-benzoquinol methylase